MHSPRPPIQAKAKPELTSAGCTQEHVWDGMLGHAKPMLGLHVNCASVTKQDA